MGGSGGSPHRSGAAPGPAPFPTFSRGPIMQKVRLGSIAGTPQTVEDWAVSGIFISGTSRCSFTFPSRYFYAIDLPSPTQALRRRYSAAERVAGGPPPFGQCFLATVLPISPTGGIPSGADSGTGSGSGLALRLTGLSPSGAPGPAQPGGWAGVPVDSDGGRGGPMTRLPGLSPVHRDTEDRPFAG
jgi:hypothetical protein